MLATKAKKIKNFKGLLKKMMSNLPHTQRKTKRWPAGFNLTAPSRTEDPPILKDNPQYWHRESWMR